MKTVFLAVLFLILPTGAVTAADTDPHNISGGYIYTNKFIDVGARPITQVINVDGVYADSGSCEKAREAALSVPFNIDPPLNFSAYKSLGSIALMPCSDAGVIQPNSGLLAKMAGGVIFMVASQQFATINFDGIYATKQLCDNAITNITAASVITYDDHGQPMVMNTGLLQIVKQLSCSLVTDPS